MGVLVNPHVLPATTHSYLARAAESLSEAVQQPSQFTELVSADVPEANSDFGQ